MEIANYREKKTKKKTKLYNKSMYVMHTITCTCIALLATKKIKKKIKHILSHLIISNRI